MGDLLNTILQMMMVTAITIIIVLIILILIILVIIATINDNHNHNHNTSSNKTNSFILYQFAIRMKVMSLLHKIFHFVIKGRNQL